MLVMEREGKGEDREEEKKDKDESTLMAEHDVQ